MEQQGLTIIAHIQARPDKIDELKAVLTKLVEPSRQEPGCVSYDMLVNMDNKTDFTFIEVWESKDAFESHLRSKHFTNAAIALPGLIDGEPDIRKYTLA